MKASIAAGHHSHWERCHGTANDAARLDEGPLTGAKAKMAGHIWPTAPSATSRETHECLLVAFAT